MDSRFFHYMELKTTQKGELFLLSEMILWSLFPVISILTFHKIAPLLSAAISTLIAAGFFAVLLTFKNQWGQISLRSAWKPILYSSVIIGVAFYGLVFTGLSFTSAGNASMIFLMEIFFTMVILGFWGKEQVTKRDIAGGTLMFLGALIILFPGTLEMNKGDVILLLATAIPPVGNYYAQQARKLVSSEFMLFVRSIISGLFLLFLCFLVNPDTSFSLLPSILPFLLLNGLFILGLSKILWLEAIHRISITKAVSLHAITPAVTMIFAYFFLFEVPTVWQFLGFIPLFLGVQLLSDFFPKTTIQQKAPTR